MDRTRKTIHLVRFLVCYVFVMPSKAQEWNCTSSEVDFCHFSSKERRTWHEASVHCFQRNGGLAHSNHTQFIVDRVIWPSEELLWTGLAWVDGRLQWMTHTPQEETNLVLIDEYARKRQEPTKLCYFMVRNGTLIEELCEKQLFYICVKPASRKEDVWLNNTIPARKIELKLAATGTVKIHHPFFVVNPAAGKNFMLSCNGFGDLLTNCSHTRIRWLKNGAYQPHVDNSWFISDKKSRSVASKLSWMVNWIGKVACEVFCFSNGNSYRSEEAILVLAETVALRIEYQFRSAPVNLISIRQHFDKHIQHELKRHISKSITDFRIDSIPFLPYPDVSTTTFSFYTIFGESNPDRVLALATYLSKEHDNPKRWLGNSLEHDGTNSFRDIKIILLNFCLENEIHPRLVFASQPTFSRGYDSRDRSGVTDNSLCQYASKQCKADWYNPTKWETRPQSLSCLRCLAKFSDHKERCLAVIRPQPFSNSIAQCLARYDLDQKDNLWDLSDWIQLSLDWINVNKNSGNPLNFNQIWLPIKRRTNLGPLRPVWPWNSQESNELKESSWGEEIKSIVNRTGLRPDWSQLNASESCLTLDIPTKTLKSASCQTILPMICVRPKLNGSLSYGVSGMYSTSAQCPLGWVTSELIAERNVCYKTFYNEVGLSFDEAEEECQKYGGHLVVVAEPSTLTVFIHVINLEELDSEFWIGLKKVRGKYEWVDKSSWTYEHLAEWMDDTNQHDTFNWISMIVDFSDFKQRKVKWRRHQKEARLSSFVCQIKTFPQREAALQIKSLNRFYQPEVSISQLEIHQSEIRHTSVISMDTLLQTDISAIHFEVDRRPVKEAFLSNLFCFMKNSTVTSFYGSQNATLNYKMIQPKTSNPSQLMWRAAETSCETWENWSTESLQASWIMPGDGNTVNKLSSYIVRLRHRNQTYSSLSHDATFQASDSQRAAFGRILPITDELVKNDLRNYFEIMQAYDPISFETESQFGNALLVKYQIVFKRKPTRMRAALTSDSIFSLRDVAVFSQLYQFVTHVIRNNTSLLLRDFDLVSIRSTDYCPGEITNMYGEFLNFSYGVIERSMNESTESELEWLQSSAGSWVEPTPLCVTQDGILLRRRCLGDRFSGLYWESIENKFHTSLCVATSPLFQKLLETMKMTNTSQILETIRHCTEGWNPSGAELELLAKSLSRSVEYSQELNSADLDHLAMIIQQITDLDTGKLIIAHQSTLMSSNLAKATEQLLTKMSTLDQKSIENSIQRIELLRPFMAARSFDRQNEDNNFIGFSVATNENSIIRSDFLLSQATYETIKESDVVVLLPSYQLQPTLGKQRVTFVAYPDTRLIDASAASGKFSSAVFNSDPSQPSGLVQSDKLYTGAGGMVQVNFNPRPMTQMDKPITVLFRPTRNVTGNRHLLRCAYWEERANFGRGGWSTDGCWLESTDRNGMEVCRCNHLSTFTLLVCQSEDYLQSTVHGAILNVITIIGSLVSIFGLSLILATFAIFRTWRKSRGHKLLVQLSIALIALLLTFIGGVNNVSNTHACRAAGVFLHYFLLAAFCWMTVEAYHQYLRMVKVFDTYIPRFLMKASIFAWTVPLIPVIIILIYDVDSYTGNEKYCWLEKTPFYVSVLLPLILLMLINTSLFVVVIRSILASGRGLRTNQSDVKQNREKLLACFLNVILFGLSWIFGFLSVGSINSVIFSYLFCVTTSFQGFFLFVMYVVRDSSARLFWLKFFGITSSKPVTKKQSKGTPAQSPTDTNLDSTEGTNFSFGPIASSTSVSKETTDTVPSSDSNSPFLPQPGNKNDHVKKVGHAKITNVYISTSRRLQAY